MSHASREGVVAGHGECAGSLLAHRPAGGVANAGERAVKLAGAVVLADVDPAAAAKVHRARAAQGVDVFEVNAEIKQSTTVDQNVGGIGNLVACPQAHRARQGQVPRHGVDPG